MRRFLLTALLFAGIAGSPAYATEPDTDIVPERATERIKASKVRARASWRLFGNGVKLGLPVSVSGADRRYNVLSKEDYSEIITGKDGVWISRNPEASVPNWIMWEADPSTELSRRDKFRPNIPDMAFHIDPLLWAAIIDECYSWSWEKPSGDCSIVCGPMISEKALKERSLRQAEPFAYFVVMCKKAKSVLGYKSIGFIIPNNQESKLREGIYAFSTSVNIVEYRTGFDYFSRLIPEIEEAVEEMTALELFCPYIELDDEFDYSEDWHQDVEDLEYLSDRD